MGSCVSFQIKVQILAFNTDVCTTISESPTLLGLTSVIAGELRFQVDKMEETDRHSPHLI